MVLPATCSDSVRRHYLAKVRPTHGSNFHAVGGCAEKLAHGHSMTSLLYHLATGADDGTFVALELAARQHPKSPVCSCRQPNLGASHHIFPSASYQLAFVRSHDWLTPKRFSLCETGIGPFSTFKNRGAPRLLPTGEPAGRKGLVRRAEFMLADGVYRDGKPLGQTLMH